MLAFLRPLRVETNCAKSRTEASMAWGHRYSLM